MKYAIINNGEGVFALVVNGNIERKLSSLYEALEACANHACYNNIEIFTIEVV